MMLSASCNILRLAKCAATLSVPKTGTPIRVSSFHSTAARSTSLSTNYQQTVAPDIIRKKLKWGFNIYRCDYQNDDAWRAFMQIWSEEVSSGVRSLYVDGDRIAGALDMSVYPLAYAGAEVPEASIGLQEILL